MQVGHLINLFIKAEIDPTLGRPPGLSPSPTCLALELNSPNHWLKNNRPPTIRAIFRSPPTGRYRKGSDGSVHSDMYSPDRYRPGKWHHVVGRVDAKEFSLFVDGERKVSEKIKFPKQKKQELTIRLGRLLVWDAHHNTRQFTGAIDEVAIYDRALNDEEIRRHFNAVVNLSIHQ